MRGLLEEILSPEKPGLEPLDAAPVSRVLKTPEPPPSAVADHLAAVAQAMLDSSAYKDRACKNLDTLTAELAELQKAFVENLDAARQNLLVIRSLVSQIHA